MYPCPRDECEWLWVPEGSEQECIPPPPCEMTDSQAQTYLGLPNHTRVPPGHGPFTLMGMDPDMAVRGIGSPTASSTP
uniref:Uncharacterized protein n=1 Tax=Magallana gigas TaxID=29159 RepID=K1Q5S0_MAGGI